MNISTINLLNNSALNTIISNILNPHPSTGSPTLNNSNADSIHTQATKCGTTKKLSQFGFNNNLNNKNVIQLFSHLVSNMSTSTTSIPHHQTNPSFNLTSPKMSPALSTHSLLSTNQPNTHNTNQSTLISVNGHNNATLINPSHPSLLPPHTRLVTSTPLNTPQQQNQRLPRSASASTLQNFQATFSLLHHYPHLQKLSYDRILQQFSSHQHIWLTMYLSHLFQQQSFAQHVSSFQQLITTLTPYEICQRPTPKPLPDIIDTIGYTTELDLHSYCMFPPSFPPSHHTNRQEESRLTLNPRKIVGEQCDDPAAHNKHGEKSDKTGGEKNTKTAPSSSRPRGSSRNPRRSRDPSERRNRSNADKSQTGGAKGHSKKPNHHHHQTEIEIVQLGNDEKVLGDNIPAYKRRPSVDDDAGSNGYTNNATLGSKSNRSSENNIQLDKGDEARLSSGRVSHGSNGIYKYVVDEHGNNLNEEQHIRSSGNVVLLSRGPLNQAGPEHNFILPTSNALINPANFTNLQQNQDENNENNILGHNLNNSEKSPKIQKFVQDAITKYERTMQNICNEAYHPSYYPHHHHSNLFQFMNMASVTANHNTNNPINTHSDKNSGPNAIKPHGNNSGNNWNNNNNSWLGQQDRTYLIDEREKEIFYNKKSSSSSNHQNLYGTGLNNICYELIEKALAAGSKDNISALLIFFRFPLVEDVVYSLVDDNDYLTEQNPGDNAIVPQNVLENRIDARFDNSRLYQQFGPYYQQDVPGIPSHDINVSQ